MASVLKTFVAKSQHHVKCMSVQMRCISKSAMQCEKPVVIPPVKEAAAAAGGVSSDDVNVILGGRKHRVNQLEKRFLVWAGKYKSIDEVPATVAQESVEKARNKARIRIANYMILATIIGCFTVVISGKNAAKRGESVQQMNLDWHRQIKEDSEMAKAK